MSEHQYEFIKKRLAPCGLHCGKWFEQCKLFKPCNVHGCSEAKNVDFCFQCNEFPCTKTGFDEHLYKRHVSTNSRIKEIGLEVYYEEVKDLSRY